MSPTRRCRHCQPGDIAMLELELVRGAGTARRQSRHSSSTEHPAVASAAAATGRKRSIDLARYTVVRAPRAGIVSHLPQVGDHVVRRASRRSRSLRTRRVDRGELQGNGPRLGAARAARRALPWTSIRAAGGADCLDSVAQATGSEFALLPAQNASGNWVKVCSASRSASRCARRTRTIRRCAAARARCVESTPIRRRGSSAGSERWM